VLSLKRNGRLTTDAAGACPLLDDPLPKQETAVRKKPSIKELPLLALIDLPPPYPDYPYFEGHECFPFEHRSTGFSLSNAWWLAEVATLVYAAPEVVLPYFERAGLGQSRFFEGGNTQCYVAANDRFAIVGFRGSELSAQKGTIDFQALAGDFLTDANFWMSDWDNGGKVHRGFKKALDDVWGGLFPHLESIRERGCPLWMTGHSLGAALATLAGSRFASARAVYTFGSPRVGNVAFSEKYSARCYRFVYNQDIVTRIPPPLFYRHVGEIRFIDGHGKIRPPADACQKTECLRQEDLEEPQDVAKCGPLPRAIRDHVPLYYAVSLWNNLVDEWERLVDKRP
jgi:hypothetical protein